MNRTQWIILTRKSVLIAAVFVAQTAAVAQSPKVVGQVICHGDSLTWGANASSGLGIPGQLRPQAPDTATPAIDSRNAGLPTDTTYPAVLARALGPAWRVGSVGTGGWTLSGLTNEAPSKIDPLFDPKLETNVLVIFGGTNDLGGAHESADAAFEKLKNYCLARRVAHPWRILIITPPMAAYPRVYPPDFDAQMVQYDALIRKNWRTMADGIVDIQANPRMGAIRAERDPQLFSDHDFTHLTDSGYALIGQSVAYVVKRLPSLPSRTAESQFRKRHAEVRKPQS